MNDTKQTLINVIKANLNDIGVGLDCSRYEDSYSGYVDARGWYMKYAEEEIDLQTYLEGLSLETLKKINNEN